MDSGTQERKNKGKRPIDVTGINKVPIVDKCPVNKSLPTLFPTPFSPLFLYSPQFPTNNSQFVIVFTGQRVGSPPPLSYAPGTQCIMYVYSCM